MSLQAHYHRAIVNAPLVRRIGHVRRVAGLALEVDGLDASVGEVCQVMRKGSPDGPAAMQPVLAEVVGVQAGHASLMAYGSLQGLGAGCEVVPHGHAATIAVGDALRGRVIDAFGHPMDAGALPACTARRALHAPPANPLGRPRISKVFETGVRAIDSLLTLGRGQRVGIFAGSGVGKSTLLGMIARHAQADVNVIALIGERGREVREFIEEQLGAQGLARTVVVVATSDQPALMRLRAAYGAVAIAEHFREQGQHVLLTMDSVTRFAMARREVGLAAGEPPTARGYTPSVFSELPQLCERCGTAASGGSITALLTVLVEGDDMNEPIADAMRAILDGHIVLGRHLAHRGHYPAIDVLQSASRVMPHVAPQDHLALAREAISTIALLERNRQLVELGAYERGSNPELDAALEIQPQLQAWLKQAQGGVAAADALTALSDLLVPDTRAKGARL
jgi:flagellum-specific ATP synthase